MFKIALFLVVFAILSSSNAHAGAFSKFLGNCAAWFEKPFKHILESNKNEVLILTDKDEEGKPLIALSLSKQLGAGFFGQVIIVDELISSNNIELWLRILNGRHYEGRIAAKIPHALREIHMGRAMYYSNKANKAEVSDFEVIKANLPKIEAHPLYPKKAAWRKGVIPSAPILGAVRTERGLIIFKPLIEDGLGLKEIGKIIHDNNGELPRKFKDGIRDYYDFIQATYGTVKGFSIDGRSPNLLWLQGQTEAQKKQLDFLGYDSEGIISFEVAQVPFKKPQYINGKGVSPIEFEAEFIGYAQRAFAEAEAEKAAQPK